MAPRRRRAGLGRTLETLGFKISEAQETWFGLQDPKAPTPKPCALLKWLFLQIEGPFLGCPHNQSRTNLVSTTGPSNFWKLPNVSTLYIRGGLLTILLCLLRSLLSLLGPRPWPSVVGL